MLNGMNTKEHYKMYKKGKAWVFAGIVTATLALGVTGGQTAHADTTGDAASEQENTSSQSASPAKEVTLTQKSAANAADTTTVSDATKTDEPANTDGQNPDTTKSSEEATASEGNPDTTKTGEPTRTGTKTTVTLTTPKKAVTETVKAPATTTKDVTDTIKEPATKVTTAVTPDMKIQAPTQAKMKHTARMMAPAAPTVTAAVVAAQPVSTTDESIDQWMPNKTLQRAVLGTLQDAITTGNQAVVDSGKKWNSVDDITQADMALLTNFSISAMGLTTYVDGKNSFSLEGLQYAINLKELDISNSMNWAPYMLRGDITDLTPLENLQNLEWLEFTGNRVSDITPVTGLKNLKSLNFAQNNVADFSSMNLAQYTSYEFRQQFVENKPVYIPKTGSYVMDNPVKAPQGLTFTMSNVARLGVPISNPVGNNPTPTVRIFWGGADTVTMDGNQLSYKGIKDQIMPGPTENPFDFMYPNLVQEEYTYFLITLFDGAPNGVANTQVMMVTPYIQADAAKDVTVNYIDETGKALADPDTLTGFVGEGYTATPKEFAGYTLTTIPANATGTFSDTAQTVTFVYKEAVSAVTVHYQDDQGATIKPDDTETGKVGDAYAIDHPAISGYTYKETVGDATGTYADTPTEVTFIYTKDAVTPPIVTPTTDVTVTVHYQTADGTQVAPDVVITGKTGDAYTTSPATNIPDGYELVTTPANATGTMGDSDITVTYLYAETGGDGDQVNPGPDKPTTPTKPTEPTTEPDKVTPTKPAKQPAKGGQADRVTTGQRTPAKGGTAATVALAAKPDASAPSANAKTTLPQTDEHTISPLWGLALLGGLLGLVGFRKKQR
ncbi:MucBP domain-containing protein [Levilactobacillus yiduensis]|uniref:MucBP domain-containing protein n=1 Tax=Levilactobacillus yiduensis TaxID=2953880 RepID=UPI001AD7F19D|nr:MucBP domain-containing protein [Levilactobacillus yiduensis]